MAPILVVAAMESRRRLVDILLGAGYSVVEAAAEEDVLKAMSCVSPDLVLMAIVMPDSNGLELAAKLRRNFSSESLSIVLLGSIPPIGINDEPLASLVSGYLSTDVSAHDLLSTVRRLRVDRG
jgi:PleD family two-component response regulator